MGVLDADWYATFLEASVLPNQVRSVHLYDYSTTRELHLYQ